MPLCPPGGGGVSLLLPHTARPPAAASTAVPQAIQRLEAINPLPNLFMRTVIGALTVTPKLTDMAMELLKRLITKQVSSPGTSTSTAILFGNPWHGSHHCLKWLLWWLHLVAVLVWLYWCGCIDAACCIHLLHTMGALPLAHAMAGTFLHTSATHVLYLFV